jgi:hypothetical protein
MRRALVMSSARSRRPSGTVVREWHRLASSASGTSGGIGQWPRGPDIWVPPTGTYGAVVGLDQLQDPERVLDHEVGA